MALVFGYGSLMSAASAARTLGREPALVPAMVRGWRRSWTSATPTAVDRRYRCAACGGVAAGSLVVLDLVRDPQGACAGVLLECEGRELAALDARECRYHRVELVREALAGEVQAVPVWTYCRRAEHVLGEGTDAWVAAGYLEVVERAAAGLPRGLPRGHRAAGAAGARGGVPPRRRRRRALPPPTLKAVSPQRASVRGRARPR